MIRHIFRMMWNRRKQTMLTGMGMFLTFVTLFAVFSTTLASWRNFGEPLGYETLKVWQIDPENQNSTAEEQELKFDLLYTLLSSNERIESWAVSDSKLIYGAMYMDNFIGDDWQEMLQTMNVSTNFKEVLHIPMSEGRWIEEDDLKTGVIPVVLTATMREKHFPGVPLEEIQFTDNRERPYVVLGVTEDFRGKGNTSAPDEMLFIGDLENIYHRVITFKTKEDEGINFETQLLEELSYNLGEWTFTLINLEEERIKDNKDALRGPIFLLAIALFFVINAALGLFGVIWYNTERRLSEIGLRRALGSTATSIQKMVIGETLALVTFAIGVGSFFTLQIPLLGIWDKIPNSVFFTAWFMAAIFIYAVAFICSLYPSWLASKKEPATALHYE